MTGVIEQIVTLFCVNNKTQDPSIMFTWASVSYCYTDLCRLFCWILLSMLTKHRSQLFSRFVCQTMWMDTCKLCTPVISTTQWPILDYNTHQDTWIFTCVQIFIWMPPFFWWYLNWHKYFTTRWPIVLLSGFLLWCHQFICGTFRDLYFGCHKTVSCLPSCHCRPEV